jgi:two-component system invasion response regulator UvrY
MIKIVIADDHTVLREGLKALIELNPKWKVVDQASDGLQVLTSIEQHKPDILILDLTMPKLGGLEVINRLRQTNYIPRILILSAKDDNISAVKSLQAGANGFIPKKSSTDEIEFAIKAVLRGQIYLSPEVASDLINKQLNREIDSPLELLSSREREVLKLI